MDFLLTSPAFQDGEMIPKKYTCTGQNVSPPLHWTGAPKGTRSFALICDDPDAPMGTWVHWVLYNIPPHEVGLPEGVPPKESLGKGAIQGLNDFKRIGYGGPCPPPGTPHRYFWTVYALDTLLMLKAPVTKAKVLEACKTHILAQAQLMGRFGR